MSFPRVQIENLESSSVGRPTGRPTPAPWRDGPRTARRACSGLGSQSALPRPPSCQSACTADVIAAVKLVYASIGYQERGSACVRKAGGGTSGPGLHSPANEGRDGKEWSRRHASIRQRLCGSSSAGRSADRGVGDGPARARSGSTSGCSSSPTTTEQCRTLAADFMPKFELNRGSWSTYRRVLEAASLISIERTDDDGRARPVRLLPPMR